MERQWTGNPRRLSQADLSEIERLIWGGETFETAAAAVGCSTKSIQRFLALGGGLKRRVKERSALRLSLAEREELIAGSGCRRLAPADSEATGEGSLDHLARGCLERTPRLSRLAGGQRGDRARPPTQAGEVGGRLEVMPGGRARPPGTLVSSADRHPVDL
jgi:IS30 family transposase